jgi:hypothetical protein
VGNQLEILSAAAARGEKGGGVSGAHAWRTAEVVAYNVASGEHTVTFLVGRCRLT